VWTCPFYDDLAAGDDVAHVPGAEAEEEVSREVLG